MSQNRVPIGIFPNFTWLKELLNLDQCPCQLSQGCDRMYRLCIFKNNIGCHIPFQFTISIRRNESPLYLILPKQCN